MEADLSLPLAPPAPRTLIPEPPPPPPWWGCGGLWPGHPPWTRPGKARLGVRWTTFLSQPRGMMLTTDVENKGKTNLQKNFLCSPLTSTWDKQVTFLQELSCLHANTLLEAEGNLSLTSA